MNPSRDHRDGPLAAPPPGLGGREQRARAGTAGRREDARGELRPAVLVRQPEVVVTRVDMEAVAGRSPLVEILGRIPVEPVCGSVEGIEEAAQLPDLVAVPGRVSDLGDPRLDAGRVAIEDLARAGDGVVPTLPAHRPAAGKRVQSHRVDDAEDPAITHQREPVRIDRAHTAEHDLLAALLRPMAGGADHLTEAIPRGIEHPVPVVEVIRLVPELDPREAVAVRRDELVDEVGEVARPPWRRLHGRHDSARRRRVMHAREDVERRGQSREEPGVPLLPFQPVPVGPRHAGPQPLHAEPLEHVRDALDAFVLAHPEPLHDAHAVHSVSPRAASSPAATSTRSSACWSRSHSTSSATPASRSTSARKPSTRRARDVSAKQWRMSPTRT
jgi:hypothetical protein